MKITKNTTVGEIVAHDYRTSQVFKANDIDFCCDGPKTLEKASEEVKVNWEDVVTQINTVLKDENESSVDYNSWPIDLLAEYIQKRHHKYAEQKIGEIMPYLEKITAVHGEEHPELEEVLEIFKKTAGEITVHMKKEELMIFPYIKKMMKANKLSQAIKTRQGGLESPIETLLHEHDDEGKKFKRIAELTDNYTTPEDGCSTYRLTLAMLKEFEEDLHLHIHLENNILFPKSIELEKTILASNN